MNRREYIEKLFDDIKNDVELDSDVSALKTLLFQMLEINTHDSMSKWKYLLKKYENKIFDDDIDFTPLLLDYPSSLILKIGYVSFFKSIKNLSKPLKNKIYSINFNIYNTSSFIYLYILEFINKKSILEEKAFIEFLIDNKEEFPKDIFDTYGLIKKVIELHIEKQFIPTNYLLKLTHYVDNKKEQAVLKTLLIDYMDEIDYNKDEGCI